jgi:hypothetical protein
MCSFFFSVNVQSIDYISVYMKFICSTDLTLVKKKLTKSFSAQSVKNIDIKLWYFEGLKRRIAEILFVVYIVDVDYMVWGNGDNF